MKDLRNMTKKEIKKIEELLERVGKCISGLQGYHVFYSMGSEQWFDSYVTFTVFGYSDQDEGSEWTEDWCIYSDGRIRRDDKVYNNFDEFERDWA